MKRYAAAIGFLLLLLTTGSASAQQADGDVRLYERMHAITLQEIALENVDDVIVTYVVQLAEQEKMIPAGKTSSDLREAVKAALETRLDDFCEMYNATFDGCPEVYQTFRDWARDMIETRTLSTDLLHIATGYETGVSGAMGEIFTIAERTLTIRHLWRSQDDALLTPEVFPLVRAVPRPDSVTDGMFDDLGSELKMHMPGAVWRYRYGLAAFGDYCTETTDASELFEAVRERSCAVEEKLRALRDALPANALDYTPPLQKGEIVIFPLRRLDDPAHVVVWMMAENINGRVEREAGVGWDLALDPVPIGFVGGDSCDAGTLSEPYCTVVNRFRIRPGGRYEDPPKEPGENGGICHLPFARDGYLCRPLRHDRCNVEIEYKDPRSIVLTECKPSQSKQPISLTASGPDICRTGWWRIPASSSSSSQGSGETEKSSCSLCIPKMQCESDCEGHSALTNPKDEDGKIRICISTSAPRSLLLHNVIHELVHAQQLCNLPPGTKIFDTAERCCANEYEAYRASCRILAEDGVLEEAGASIEECAGGLANVSCERYGDRICSEINTVNLKQKIDEVLERRASESQENFPTCEELIGEGTGSGKFDTRPLSMVEAMNMACSPGCKTQYENTIGNNLCYVGQCIEQSVEQSRLIPGRMPLNVADEAYPWDACAAEDPRAGGMMALPALSPPLPPPYNPRLLVESLDRALCQINGLPAATPPIFCQFDYERRLSIPTDNYVTTTLSFTDQIAENLNPTASLQRMTQSVSTRIGTALLSRYLTWAGRSLAETLRAGNLLMQNMERTVFPRTTCPRNATEEPDFCRSSAASY
ncbi:MAG: hypothetical protein PeribacterA2_1005 [Candidatus Peribacter riflensis]|uniref:Uncharacterized protein n=1 Tax=Candidatus Peribacter riflensis TaxID=1735162 RepID=A0A0S1SI03_9BACT|nr:MAG: hypothetical protein PeribacterA2_1005 [Candidatus Peribacter riflensis]ALM11467.1 MAG: hypothetical protein PeribacterB2_1007 [Candidatus Peribacter riflensis]ALM12569.1 MAG: hypothetical protein PeribacterC2_1006 [Candidatus Peribacter riflensis]ALM13670.1 MAG: hypothetical protein PeribacterD1_1005 [Candidatus Peribacter riflensis]ALM14773.1 MAG: hypothetical protein PeribacterD2_1007 [Candidatus Peribacter riflensis]